MTDTQVRVSWVFIAAGSAQRAAVSDPAVKQRLRDNTSWAIERGVFGVPTFVIGDELFLGHDAVDMALEYLADPAGFLDPAMRAADLLPIGATRTQCSATTRHATSAISSRR